MLSATACQSRARYRRRFLRAPSHLLVSAETHCQKQNRLSSLLTGLISDSTAGLACGLAGRLALTASALLHALLKRSGVQGLNMLHS